MPRQRRRCRIQEKQAAISPTSQSSLHSFRYDSAFVAARHLSTLARALNSLNFILNQTKTFLASLTSTIILCFSNSHRYVNVSLLFKFSNCKFLSSLFFSALRSVFFSWICFWGLFEFKKKRLNFSILKPVGILD